ncbi:flagellar MS-ring protein [Salmonella enterica subsp. enterica serovar Daytona]|uniref:Flagellar MS-ring protein n=1 Tax=Salmonella enterica subsp. enterica serovar Daytona TaxID=1962639 RepID=A0A447JGK5_SALET|nr:flagellar MS-ring protein [Salmonella enterica subsp. enterica serovar Daytona]
MRLHRLQPNLKPLEWLNRLRANPRIPLIVGGFRRRGDRRCDGAVAKTPDYRTLFSNLSDQDGGAIVAQVDPDEYPLSLCQWQRRN